MIPDEVERMRRRLGISDTDLEAILGEAQAKRWAESASCRLPDSPIYMNALLIRPEPAHPIQGRQTEESCRRRLQGVVLVGLVIRADGTASEVVVVKGIDFLDDEAIAAVRSASWFPALLCARPVPAHYTVAVPFRLSSCASVG